MSARITSAMAHMWQRVKGARSKRYELLPLNEKDAGSSKYRKQSATSPRRVAVYLVVLVTVFGIYRIFW